MNRQQISTSTNYNNMALVGTALETTAGSDQIRLWVLPIRENPNMDTAIFPELITNFLPVDKVTSSFTVHDVIVQSQNIIGISKQHLASIFRLSRQNLYNLLKNTEQKPTQETETRAKQVKRALDVISKNCPYKLGASTMTCHINGRRLLDELSESTIDLAQIEVFAQEINKRICVQQHLNLPESIIKNQEFLDTINAA